VPPSSATPGGDYKLSRCLPICLSAANQQQNLVLVVTRPPPGASQSSSVPGIMQHEKGDLMVVIIARAAK
jgi:hypothetical protein